MTLTAVLPISNYVLLMKIKGGNMNNFTVKTMLCSDIGPQWAINDSNRANYFQ